MTHHKQTLAPASCEGEGASVHHPGRASVPTVIGLDVSLTSTGIAIGHRLTRVTSTGRKADSLAVRCGRLRQLADQIDAQVRDVDLVVIEQPAYSRSQGSAHDRSGLWWLVVDRLHGRGIPVAEVAPTSRARYAAGRGNAGKDEVLAAAIRRYPDVPISGNDEADAYILAAMGLDHLGHPPVVVPQTHRAALDKVA
ncbi:hypothetical protein [Actinomadura gamaensis]|uniref:Holliday junction nuclease RuvC n=1 Tax=Actinomadura gamaensis TaxID=1763541 RepID=A0ABV9UAE1_9ACTN